MAEPLKKLTLKGFKSIESLVDFDLRSLNVLIGPNGAGKSNLVDFFRMLRAMADESLQKFVLERGGADGFLFMGPKHTRRISMVLHYGNLGDIYECDLIPTASGQMMIEEERAKWPALDGKARQTRTISRGSLESVLKREAEKDETRKTLLRGRPEFFFNTVVSNWMVYHFHDTSLSALMRRDQSVRDRSILRHDASNIAPFLLNLREKHKGNYDLIRDTVRMIAPFFDDFLLESETKGEEEKVRLEWRQKGSDYPFQAYQLSDGTIRFICLATALLQPALPATIVIDEPELGLHPFAIGLLASLIQSASTRTQIVVSTQSPALLDKFQPEDVVVVNRQGGHSTFERLNPEALREWMDDYSMAELWQKDVLRGGPSNE